MSPLFWLDVRQNRGNIKARGYRRSWKDALKSIVEQTARDSKPLIGQLLKQRYTYKGRVKVKVLRSGYRAWGYTRALKVTGGRQTIKHFLTRAPTKKRQLYAEVVRGQGGTISGGFRYNGTYFKRLTRSRLPIKALYGPSVPEMAGHEPDPATLIQRAINDRLYTAVLNERLDFWADILAGIK